MSDGCVLQHICTHSDVSPSQEIIAHYFYDVAHTKLTHLLGFFSRIHVIFDIPGFYRAMVEKMLLKQKLDLVSRILHRIL